ncbi:NAD(P)H-quinone oxidoreductase [Alphaproteobacteria bacterium]|nr:NAD(P)H-quinone oxidoreductase [Alphaproteobacteria bacterium]
MKIPKIMKCVKIKKYGSAENLVYKNEYTPSISDNDVLIKVKASGINRPDILQRLGLYSPPADASVIPGLEVSGKIIKLGKKVKNFRLNDRVCALVHGGGYAEYCKAHEKHVLPLPKGFNYIEAAGIPETYFTVWTKLFDIAKIKKNQTLLVHGGTSGIGTTAIQLAKVFGCKVITTVADQRKANFCRELGADLAIIYRKENFYKKILDYTNNVGVNVILDMIGKSYFSYNIKLLSDKGKFICIAFLSGHEVKLDLAQILKKRILITGSTLRPRTISEKARIAKNVEKFCWPLFEKKIIKPIIYKTFKLNDVIKAHKLMESSKHIGKIVLLNKN